MSFLDDAKKQEQNIYPHEGNLEIKWYMKNGVRIYTVVCRFCECNRLFVWENGLRCRECYAFHSHTAFEKLRDEVKRMSRFNDGKIEQIPQPVNHGNRKMILNAKTGERIELTGKSKEEQNSIIKKFLRV